MAGMDKIGDAILDKVKAEADIIISDAESRAKEDMAAAKEALGARIKAEKARLVDAAKAEAGRVLARSSIKSRQQLLAAKADIIAEATEKAKKAVSATKISEKGMFSLIKEAISGLNTKKAIIFVNKSDVAMAKKVVAADKKLTDMVTEVKETECSGGVIAEDTEGKTRIDNTFDTRLDILLPKLMPEISAELFGNL
ncbi:V-type ATP synthase subunit E [Chloroflexota bacterium]